LLGTAAVLGYTAVARSADHLDSPAVMAAPNADINDVYTWMDGNNVVLAMTFYPNTPLGTMFDPSLQYVFHTKSGAGLGQTAVPVDVIATFDASQNVSVWVGTSDYVTGNATNPAAPLVSADGKVSVFTGTRADPFFFNLNGFRDTVAAVEAAAPGLMFNAQGCPAIDAATSATLVGFLSHTSNGTMPPSNFFATFNAMAIVVAVDKSLLTTNGTTMSVWAGTYQ